MEYCSINPSVVLGPVWSKDYSPSVSVLQRILDGSLRAMPDVGFGIVDVRDIVNLHLRALTAPGMAGERFLASGPFLKLAAIANILRSRLGEEARKVATRSMPDFVVRIASLFNPMAKTVVGELGSVRNMDASHARAGAGLGRAARGRKHRGLRAQPHRLGSRETVKRITYLPSARSRKSSRSWPQKSSSR